MLMGGRLSPVKRRKLIAVLEANGLVVFPGRGKGGHMWMEHPEHPERCCTVPHHDEIGTGLLGEILKQAGKTREEFQERLREL